VMSAGPTAYQPVTGQLLLETNILRRPGLALPSAGNITSKRLMSR